jgi:hypothetical protein
MYGQADFLRVVLDFSSRVLDTTIGGVRSPYTRTMDPPDINTHNFIVTYPCCDVGTTNSQSEDRKTKQKTAEFVFYPSDSSTDLAFSVNLRKIAKHYVHDERVRNALTAKANEDITRRKINTFNAKGGQHTSQIEKIGIDMTGYERNLGRANIGNRNESTLDEFLSRNHGRPSKDGIMDVRHTAQSGKRSETFRKLPVREIQQKLFWEGNGIF